MPKSFARGVLLIVVFCLLCGCAGGRPLSRGDTPEGAEKKFTVVTSFYPMYITTINITKGIDRVEVTNLTKAQTGCLHDYQLTPQDVKTLESADAFVINGAGMESFMDKVITQQKHLKIIEASAGIAALKDASGEENPHVWVSVTNAIAQTGNIAEALALSDAENASQYRENAENYIKKLEALKDKMHSFLDNAANRDIVTFHEAFPYFAEEFDLNIVAVVEREPGSSPTPKEMEDTISVIKKSNVKALFAEPQYSSKAAKTIAQETGASVYTLDPVVTGEADPEAYDAYINIMEQNLITLKEALK